MPLKTELDARAVKMQSILGDINAALVQKGCESAANFGGVAQAIKSVSGGGGAAHGIIYDEIDENGNIIKATILGVPVARYALGYQNELLEVDLPAGATFLALGTFYNCNKLQSIDLPDTIATMDNNVFYGCNNMSLTRLPASLVSIGNSAFYNAKAITVKEIPEGVKTVGTYAFGNCTALTEITFKGIPDSLAKNAFNGCTNLLTLNVPWAEGTIANAPWGATKATITYNCTGA